MAREKMLITMAIDTTRKILLTFLKRMKECDDEPLRMNFYSLVVKFLKDVNKLSDLVNYAAREAEGLMIKRLKEAKNKDLKDIDYCEDVYPVARTLEAIGSLKRTEYIPSIEEGVKFVHALVTGPFVDFVDLKMGVPMLQGLLGASFTVRNVIQCRRLVEQGVEAFRQLVLELDPELRTIYGKDIYFYSKAFAKESLKPEEKELLIRESQSKFLFKVLKATEHLAAFKEELPAGTIEYLIRTLPKFVHDIFKLTNGRLEYYSPMVESLYNIVKQIDSKNVVNVIMNTLIEHSDWLIMAGEDTIEDAVRAILATGLLVASKSASYR